ncbi:hypothetical protein [Nonomuraea sp. NEAU-A123]|uniref:hypothetical protein n=1 Tax=Nonomuraea sp. NEAU-A123 TaxID=2839649 RepID=UPI001BE423F9|nr:hypothetical protein [Nonomuraea sp. NEAU-A123]MBT2234643.1 hypothetical protein [Nonomuraea sp. NEAU-A123]
MDNKIWTPVRTLFVVMLAVSVLALGVAAIVGGDWVVWVRGVAVAAAAAWLIALTGQAEKGRRAAYIRIRFVATIAPIGILLIVAVPSSGYPLWMRVEQGLVGVLLVAVATLVNRRAVRQAYPKRGKLG